MHNLRGLFSYLVNIIEQHRNQPNQKILISSISQGVQEKHSFCRFLPTLGNVIFTLLMISGVLWAQSVGAIPLLTSHTVTTSARGISYQGRLANSSGQPLTQTVNMVFRLHATASGEVPLWEEQWTGTNSVQVNDGLFNVMLGSITPIPQNVITDNSNLFLGITVGTDKRDDSTCTVS